MHTHPIHRSLGLRKYSCDSKEKGTRTLKAGQRTTIFVFNKIWQMVLGFAAIFQHASAMCQPPCKKALFSIPQGIYLRIQEY